MKYWRIEAINNKEEKAYFIEADDYSESLIRKVLKEVHPEWNIKKIVSIDAIPDDRKEA